jgi:hypothetical protein
VLELTLSDHETYCPEAPPYEEELPMTLILAMMGSDGWLLAADRRVTQTQRSDPRSSAQIPAGYFPGDERKIVSRPDLGVSYASAGSDRTREAGDRLIESIKTHAFGWEDPSGSLRRIGSEFKLGMNPPFGSERLLIIFDERSAEFDKRKASQLWKLDLGILVRAAPREHREIGGDFANAATLFPQLYYRPDRPVERLIKLAAFTIWFAAKCNPGNISDDLDILVKRPGKDPEFITESEYHVGELRDEFEQFHSEMARSLGLPLEGGRREVPPRTRKTWWRTLVSK